MLSTFLLEPEFTFRDVLISFLETLLLAGNSGSWLKSFAVLPAGSRFHRASGEACVDPVSSPSLEVALWAFWCLFCFKKTRMGKGKTCQHLLPQLLPPDSHGMFICTCPRHHPTPHANDRSVAVSGDLHLDYPQISSLLWAGGAYSELWLMEKKVWFMFE